MHKSSQIPAIIEDHIKAVSILERSEGLLDTPDVLLFSLSLPSIDRDPSYSDANTRSTMLRQKNDQDLRSSSMILSGEDVLWTVSAVAWTRRVDSHLRKRTKRLQHPRQSESQSRQQSEWSFDRDTVILKNNYHPLATHMWRHPAMRAPFKG